MSQETRPYADDDLLSEVDDDIVSSRRRPPARGTSASGPRLGWIAIVIAVFAGVAFGSWLASRSAHDPAPDPSTPVAAETPFAAEPTVAPQVRLLELEDLIAADPDDVDARLELGVLLYEELGDIEGAGQQWLAVSQIDPTNIGGWYNLGFYYLSTDPINCQSATEAWQKVIELQPLSAEAENIQSHMAAVIPERCPAESTPTPTPTAGG